MKLGWSFSVRWTSWLAGVVWGAFPAFGIGYVGARLGPLSLTRCWRLTHIPGGRLA